MCDCSSRFEDTLHYSSPAHGDWGVVRTAMLVPESYQLFVCPFACGRHGAIGACFQNLKHRLSYLYLQEADIVSGSYEELIPDAVDELLAALTVQPKALMIFVSCLDDLLGTDHEAILTVLRDRHPEVRFVFCHMNPISLDSKLPPPVNVQLKMYGLLEAQSGAKAQRVNFIGNMVPVDEQSELYGVLKSLGISQTCHISQYATFEQWQEMAQSQLNIVLLPPGLKASQDMEKRLQIPYLSLTVSYDPDAILLSYEQLAAALGKKLEIDLSGYYEQAVQALQETAEKLSGVEIVLDGSCSARPFSLAVTLLKYGFSVTEVMADAAGSDSEGLRRLTADYPQVALSQPQHHATVLFNRRRPEVLAIGFDAGYITGAKHVVGLASDEALFGFWGVRQLMAMLQAAWAEETDLEQMIHDYGLVV